MDVLEVIHSRRSVAQVASDPIVRSEIELLVEAAVRAPNHHLTEPWRFIVLTGEALHQLGETMAKRVLEEERDDPNLEARADAERKKALRAPVILTVVYVPSTNPKAVEIEDRYAVGAAIQNILLAAHARGLGAYLRTGPAARDRRVDHFLGVGEGEEIAGFVYLGKLEGEQKREPTRRQPGVERAVWMGW